MSVQQDASRQAAGSLPEGSPKSVVPGPDQESPPKPEDRLAPQDRGTRKSFESGPLPPPAGDRRDRLPAAPTVPEPAKPAPQAPPADADDNLFDLGSRERLRQLTDAVAKARSGSAEEQAACGQMLVTALLSAHEPAVRGAIVDLAATLATPEAAAICRGALADPDQGVRRVACAAWARVGGGEAVPMLTDRARSDPSPAVRTEAVIQLADSADPAALRAVAAALDDDAEVVRQEAIRVLRKSSGRDFGTDVAAWKKWAAEPTPRTATRPLVDFWNSLF